MGGRIRRTKMKSENYLEKMTKILLKELKSSGIKVTKSVPENNKVTISFKPKIRKIKKEIKNA